MDGDGARPRAADGERRAARPAGDVRRLWGQFRRRGRPSTNPTCAKRRPRWRDDPWTASSNVRTRHERAAPLPALLTAAGLDFAARAEWTRAVPGQPARPRAQPPSPRLDRHRPSTRPDDHSQSGARVACVASRAHLRRRDRGPGRRAVTPSTFAERVADRPPGERISRRLLPARPARGSDADAGSQS